MRIFDASLYGKRSAGSFVAERNRDVVLARFATHIGSFSFRIDPVSWHDTFGQILRNRLSEIMDLEAEIDE